MPRRYYAQRQHVIRSLDGLLNQLHTLSFFLSPSLWVYFVRMFAQTQCRKPRELDPSRTLRFYLASVTVCNGVAIYSHARHGAATEKALILDFIGMAFVPSTLYLLVLDMCILFLQLLLAIVAYEVSFAESSADTQDILLPIPSSPLPTTGLNSPSPFSRTKAPSTSPEFIIDLEFQTIVARLRSPPPTPAAATLLPFPNTASTPRWVHSRLERLQRLQSNRSVPGDIEVQNTE